MERVMDSKGIDTNRVAYMLAQIERVIAPKRTAKVTIVPNDEVGIWNGPDSRQVTLGDIKHMTRYLVKKTAEALKAEARVAARLELALDDAEMRKIKEDVQAQERDKIARAWGAERDTVLKRLRDEEVEKQTPIIREQVTQELTKRFKEEMEPKLKSSVARDLIAREVRATTAAPSLVQPNSASKIGLSAEDIRECLTKIRDQVANE
jgi:hypothetical protein